MDKGKGLVVDSEKSSRGKSKVISIPSRCWCRADIVPITSILARNPGRRYYRCAYAVKEQLFDDNHTFKWVDDVLVDEVERLHSSIDRVENQITEEIETLVMAGVDGLVMKKLERILEESVDNLVMDKLEKIVANKLEKMVSEKIEKLLMEKSARRDSLHEAMNWVV